MYKNQTKHSNRKTIRALNDIIEYIKLFYCLEIDTTFHIIEHLKTLLSNSKIKSQQLEQLMEYLNKENS